MNRQKKINRIIELFARFVVEIRLANENNLYDLNIHVENVVIPLLNKIYGLNLINANQKNKNYPSVDLFDEARRIAFQVTSTATSEKVKHTLKQYLKHRFYEKFDTLYIYIITEKLSTYSGKGFKEIAQDKFKFDKENNIIDNNDLIRKINEANDLLLHEILIILEAEFGEIRIDQNNYKDKNRNIFKTEIFNRWREVIVGTSSLVLFLVFWLMLRNIKCQSSSSEADKNQSRNNEQKHTASIAPNIAYASIEPIRFNIQSENTMPLVFYSQSLNRYDTFEVDLAYSTGQLKHAIVGHYNISASRIILYFEASEVDTGGFTTLGILKERRQIKDFDCLTIGKLDLALNEVPPDLNWSTISLNLLSHEFLLAGNDLSHHLHVSFSSATVENKMHPHDDFIINNDIEPSYCWVRKAKTQRENDRRRNKSYYYIFYNRYGLKGDDRIVIIRA